MYKTINELQVGDIVNEDLYFKQSLLIKKGTELQHSFITKLQRFGIRKIAVLAPIHKFSGQQLHHSFDQKIKQLEKMDQQENTTLASFYQTAKNLITENRYGLALNNEEQLTLVTDHFAALMKKPFVHKLFSKMKKRDAYTYKHVVDVFILGVLFAKYLGLPRVSFMAEACLLHDVGNLSVPLSILQKEGPLTIEEFEIVKKHPIAGEQILEAEEETHSVGYLARQHHERLDGSGYPDGLREENLDQYTRILMIVDVFSALTLDRSYQAAKSSQEALSIMSRSTGKFDSTYLKRFMEMLHIYAKNTVVRLSNGDVVQILEANDYNPYLPKLRNLKTKQIDRLPIHLSTNSAECLYLPQEAGEECSVHTNSYSWEQFMNYLLAGNYTQTVHAFRDITHQLSIDQTYMDIIKKTLLTIIKKLNSEDMTISEVYLAFQDIHQLLKQTKEPVLGSVDTKRKILVVTPGPQEMPLINRFIQHSFMLKGWEAISLEHELAIIDIATYMKRHDIKYMCTFLTPMTDISEIEMFLQVFKKYYPTFLVTLCTEFYQSSFSLKNHSDFFGSLEELIEKLTLFYSMSENGDFLDFTPQKQAKGEFLPVGMN